MNDPSVIPGARLTRSLSATAGTWAAIKFSAGLAVAALRGKPRSAIAYEASRRSAADIDFAPPGLGPNAAMEQPGFGGTAAESLVRGVTYELDNNPVLDAAVDDDIAAVVRTGIDEVEPRSGDKDFDQAMRRKWDDRWAKAADPSRLLTIGQQQSLYRRECWRTGECGVRVVMAPATRGYPEGPAIELVPSERLPRTLTGTAPNGNQVRASIEFNAFGQVVAFWVLRYIPQDDSLFGQATIPGMTGGWSFGLSAEAFKDPALERVPVEEMDLRFRRRRAAQARGVPDLCSVLGLVRTERTYTEATMTTANLAAAIGMFFEAPNDAAFAAKKPGDKTPFVLDAQGNVPKNIGRGLSLNFLAKGTKLLGEFASKLPGPTFQTTVGVLHKLLSRRLGRMPASVSGDFGEVNFAAAQMAQLGTNKTEAVAQDDVWQMTEPYYRACVLHEIGTKGVNVPATLTDAADLFRVKVVAPGAGAANPESEAAADEIGIRSGTKSRAECVHKRGRRVEDVIKEEIEYEQLERELRSEAGLPEKLPASSPSKEQSGRTSADRADGPAGDRKAESARKREGERAA